MYNTPHEKQTVYLSGSWDLDHTSMNLFVASLLAAHDLIVIGDHPSQPAERNMNYAARVNEHLRNCAGIVLVFPHREFYKQSTSSAMFIELLLAAKYRLPMLILLEDGVVLEPTVGETETTLAFGSTAHDAEAIVRFDAVKDQLDDDRINAFKSSFIISKASAIVLPTPSFIDQHRRLVAPAG